VVRISLPVVSGNGSGAGGNGPAAGSGHSGLVDYLGSD
jgi:hypothetical protein